MCKNAIKENTIRTILLDNLAFIILLVMMTVLHIFIYSPIADDKYFTTILDVKQMSLFDMLIERYNGWTSRVLIEAVLISIVGHVKLWKIINIIICTTLPFFVSKILKCDRKGNWFILFLSLVFPFYMLCDVGWVATTTNYLWPVWCAVFVMYILSRYKRSDGHISFVWYIISIPLILFGSNAEQCSGLIFVVVAFFIAEVIIEKKRELLLFPLVLLLLNIASIVFILSAPGNAIRQLAETRLFFPGYEQFDFFDKIFLGISNSFRVTFSEGELMMICMLIVLLIFVYRAKRRSFEVVFAIIPVFLTVGYLVSSNLNKNAYFADRVSEGHSSLMEYVFPTALIVVDKNEIDGRVLQIVIYYVLIVVSILISLYLIYREDIAKFVFYSLYVLSGFGLSVIICFASTMYTSAFRTSIYALLGFAFILVAIYKDMKKKKSVQGLNEVASLDRGIFASPFIVIAACVAVFNYIYNLYGIINITSMNI